MSGKELVSSGDNSSWRNKGRRLVARLSGIATGTQPVSPVIPSEPVEFSDPSESLGDAAKKVITSAFDVLSRGTKVDHLWNDLHEYPQDIIRAEKREWVDLGHAEVAIGVRPVAIERITHGYIGSSDSSDNANYFEAIGALANSGRTDEANAHIDRLEGVLGSEYNIYGRWIEPSRQTMARALLNQQSPQAAIDYLESNDGTKTYTFSWRRPRLYFDIARRQIEIGQDPSEAVQKAIVTTRKLMNVQLNADNTQEAINLKVGLLIDCLENHDLLEQTHGGLNGTELVLPSNTPDGMITTVLQLAEGYKPHQYAAKSEILKKLTSVCYKLGRKEQAEQIVKEGIEELFSLPTGTPAAEIFRLSEVIHSNDPANQFPQEVWIRLGDKGHYSLINIAAGLTRLGMPKEGYKFASKVIDYEYRAQAVTGIISKLLEQGDIEGAQEILGLEQDLIYGNKNPFGETFTDDQIVGSLSWNTWSRDPRLKHEATVMVDFATAYAKRGDFDRAREYADTDTDAVQGGFFKRAKVMREIYAAGCLATIKQHMAEDPNGRVEKAVIDRIIGMAIATGDFTLPVPRLAILADPNMVNYNAARAQTLRLIALGLHDMEREQSNIAESKQIKAPKDFSLIPTQQI